MSRTLTAAMITESKKGHIFAVFLLAKLELDGGDIRVTTLDRDITFNSEIYTGIGDFAGGSAITETHTPQAAGLQLSMSGIPLTHVSFVLNENYSERKITIWLGFLNEAGQIVADPTIEFQGQIDQMGIELGRTATVTITCENKFVKWERPNERRYTNADQQERFAGDEGLELVNQAVEKVATWGRA